MYFANTNYRTLFFFYFFPEADSVSRAAIAAPPQQPVSFSPRRLRGFSIIASGLKTTLSRRVVSGVIRNSKRRSISK